jgi:hypothetical protein
MRSCASVRPEQPQAGVDEAQADAHREGEETLIRETAEQERAAQDEECATEKTEHVGDRARLDDGLWCRLR